MNLYLAGGITKCTREEVTVWRQKVKDALPLGIHIFTPLTGKEIFSENGLCETIGGGLTQGDAIFAKDLFLMDNSDIVLFNFDTVKSIGTPFELGYCYAKGKQIVTVCSDARANHPFIKYAGVVYDKLDDAIEYINHLYMSFKI
jgi:nucleoside 2-deoxyribosyltransferase